MRRLLEAWLARATEWWQRASEWRLRDSQIFLALTIVIGVLAGLSAVLFALSIDAVSYLLFGMDPGPARLILVPTLMSVVTGVLLAKYFTDVRGSGVPQTKVAYHLRQGVIHPRVPIGKFLTGVLTIGSGHSLGREGPSVQIGAGVASSIGRWMRLPPKRIQALVPVGASAALAAAFNTPVAAVLFALEEIIDDLNAPLLGSTVIASVAAVIVERSILGNAPLFEVPIYQLEHPAELLAYVALGVIGGFASVAFSKGLLGARGFFLRLPAETRMWQPAVGGLAIGLVLIVVPEVGGVGYPHIDQALNGGLFLQAMILLCVVKGCATIISYSTGNAGGIFAPSLFLGAMVGGIVGLLVQDNGFFPVGAPGAYALVGMGALFAGIIRAPLTSVFMIFEITQDYQIFVPLMVANMISLFISRRYQPEPVYRALLKQDGVHLPEKLAKKSAGGWRAGDVMSREIPLVESGTTAKVALEMATRGDVGCFLVGRRDRVTGLVSRARLAEEVAAGRDETVVGELATETWAHVHPDHGIDIVLDRYRKNPGVLPVLSRVNVNTVVGVVTQETLMGVFGTKATAKSAPAPAEAPEPEPAPTDPPDTT